MAAPNLQTLPVSAADLTALQAGISFGPTNLADATAEAVLINAGNPSPTVQSYANVLLANQIGLSQVVMAADSLMFGQVDTVAEMNSLTNSFLPAQLAFWTALPPAIQSGTGGSIVWDAEVVGFALSGPNGNAGANKTAFATNFASLNTGTNAGAAGDIAFDSAVSSALGGAVSVQTVDAYLKSFRAFFTANPIALNGADLGQGTDGITFGTMIGILLSNTSTSGANLEKLVSNALIDNAEGTLKVGTALGLQPAQIPLQGSAVSSPSQTFTLATGTDTIPGLIGSKGTTDTTGNDTIIGTNIGAAATFTMNPGDQIDAGTGTNQFKLFADGGAAAVAQSQFPTLVHVQNLFINHFGGHTLNVTTSQFPNLTALQDDNQNGGGAATTSDFIVKNDLVTYSNDSTGGNTYRLSSVADTSENVTFNTVGTFGAHSTLDAAFPSGAATSATITALTINSIGAPNFVDYSGSAGNIATITFATNPAGDTAFTGNQFHPSTLSETIDASDFTASLTLGTTGAALAASTAWGDGGSGFGDTVKLGSGTTYFAERAVTDGFVGDNITLLAAHAEIDTLDSTATTAYLQATAYTSLANENKAMTTATNFNLGNGAALSSDILKMGVTTQAVGSATDIGTVNGHLYTNVGTGTGFVTAAGVTTAAQFLADVFATAAAVAKGDVIAWVDTANHNTYVAEFNVAATANHVEIVELIGVSTATALSTTGGVTGTIHIA